MNFLPPPRAQPVCLQPGCNAPSWNGQSGEFCSRTCREAASTRGPAQTPPVAKAPCCLQPACGKPTWNNSRNEFCSRTCRQLGLPHALCAIASRDQYEEIQEQFTSKWDTRRGLIPNIKAIWVVHASKQVRDRFHDKCQAIGNVKVHGTGRNPGNRQRRFHGTFLKCKFSGKPCSNPACSACCIISNGFDISKLGQGSGNNGWYGPGHYSTSLPSTAVGYGDGRTILVVHVAVGVAEKTSNKTAHVVSAGCHSRVVNKSTGVDELLVPEDEQMLPAYLILV